MSLVDSPFSKLEKCARCGKVIQESGAVVQDSITKQIYLRLGVDCGCYKVWAEICSKVRQNNFTRGVHFDFDSKEQMLQAINKILGRETFVLS